MNGRKAKERRRAESARAAHPDRVGHPAHMREVPNDGIVRDWNGKISEDVGTIVAWCADESDLQAARKQTHDSLIKLMGSTRTGGVSWLQRTGDEAVELLNEVAADPPTEEHGNYFRQIRGKLREFGGWVVVAMAPAER